MISKGLITMTDLRNLYKLNMVVNIEEAGWTPNIQMIDKPNQSFGINEHFKSYEEAFDRGWKATMKIINERGIT